MLQRYVNILSDQREELTNRQWKNIVRREEEKEINLNSPLAQVVIGVRRSGFIVC